MGVVAGAVDGQSEGGSMGRAGRHESGDGWSATAGHRVIVGAVASASNDTNDKQKNDC